MYNKKNIFEILTFVFALLLFIFIFIPFSFSNDPKAESKTYFNQGIKLFEKKDYEGALSKFHKAYVIYPHWKIRKNIGLCYMKMGENVLALQELNGYLEEGKSELSSKEKQIVMDVIFEILQKVGILRFYNIPGGAEIIIDGQVNSEARMGKDVYVEPGTHVVSAMSSTDKLLMRQEIYLNPGETKEIDVSTYSKSPVETKPEETTQIPGWQEIKEKKKRNIKVLHPAIFGLTLSISLGLGISAIGTGAHTIQLNNDFKNPNLSEEEFKNIKNEGEKYQTITNGLIGGFAGMGAVSLILYFFTNFRRTKKTTNTESYPSISLVPSFQSGKSSSLYINLIF